MKLFSNYLNFNFTSNILKTYLLKIDFSLLLFYLFLLFF